MKTTFWLLIALLLLSLKSNILIAQRVTINKAIDVAKNHMSIVASDKLKSAYLNNVRPQLFPISSSVAKTDTLMYVLNDTINNNFVIVAADECVWPIIGYSLNGRYTKNDQPPAFSEWIENKKREIQYIKQNNIKPQRAVSQQWDNLSSSNFYSAEVSTSVEPLLKTTWNQGCYFNANCPSDVNGPCGHALTGCVATSMAQIMKYWGYPTKGTGSNSYSHSDYGILTADFGATTYQWSQMPDIVTGPNDAIATLMFHCGVSVEMDYGPATSGAGEPIIAFFNLFNYSPDAKLVEKSSYSESEWVDLLKTELDLKRPVWYMGNSSDAGHAWVCDGYQNSDYFHFNWGWGGNQDGYFYLGSMNYNTEQAAIVKIAPTSLPDGYQGFYLSENTLTIGGNGGTATTNISSGVNWKATSDQSWLSVLDKTGIPGTSIITLSAYDNNTNSNRSATVTISAVGFNDQFITVNQGTNFYFNPVLIHPGSLHDVLGSNLASITRLQINDAIDARDFKTMRDEMPLLAELDLTNAIITEYTGTGGTAGIEPMLQTYPSYTIPDDAFYSNSTYKGKTSLTKVILPELLTSIGFRAFDGCHGLTSVTIPNTVITIRSNAFSNCISLTSIYIPASVATIENTAFAASSGMITVASDNANYSSSEGVLFDKNQNKLFHCPISKSGSYSIPPTVISIESHAFAGCNLLTSITIPTSVNSIGRNAFYYCHGLSSITIPWSVTFIGEKAFWYNKALIFVSSDNPVYSSFDGALFNKDKTKLIQCSYAKSSFNIPSTVTEIGAHSFENCSKLTSVTIPSSVNTIGEYAFWSTCNLSDVYIPSSVTSIGECAFHALGTYSHGIVKVSNTNQNYSSIDGVLFDKPQKKLIMYPDFKTGTFVIPSTVETIDNYAFLYCPLLTSLIIPSSVTAIGHDAFAHCHGLQSIVTRSKTPVMLSSIWYHGTYNVFNGVNKSACTLYVPYYTKDLYAIASQWKDFINIKEAKQGFLPGKFSDYLKSGEGSTTTIDLKANVKWIATSDQPWLTVSPASGTGDAALKFSASSNTSSSMRIAKVTISAEGFESDTIIITQSYKVTIKAGGLHDTFATMLNTMISIEISGTIDARDFKTMRDEMPSLAHVDLSDATIVAYSGSGGTDFITSPTSYPANTIPDYAFVNSKWEGKPNLISITFPIELNAIGPHALGHSGLTSIDIPASVKSIGGFAFYECTRLTSIQVMSLIPVNLSSSPNVFYNVDKTACKLSVPFGSISLYSAADEWKDFTNVVEMPGLFLSTNKVDFLKNDGTSTVMIGSSVPWMAESNQSWLTIDATSGAAGTKTIILTATANNTNSPRFAVITISASGLASQTISITQYGTTEVTAGNLHNVLADLIGTITSLTLSGTIDARDFKTMRDEMTSLTDIDLSAATIVAYSGTEGTSNSNTNYYSNVIPDYSFFNPATLKAKANLISVDLPLNTNSIGYQSFTNCKSLSSISIPSSVSSVSSYAFNGCTSLNSVNLSASVYSIGSFAFVGCKASINVNEENLYFSSLDGVLFNKTKTTIIQCPTSKSGDYTIPSTVTTIGTYSFYLCRNLTSVKIPPLVNFIGDRAFSSCNALQEIIIPTSVLSIGHFAFKGCTNLSSIKVFWLTPLNLNSVIGIFDDINKIICALYVPYGSKTYYQTANQWKDFTNIIEIPGFLVSSKSLTIPADVNSSASIEVTSYTSWNVNSDQPWLKVSPSTFAGNGTISILATANTTAEIRTATVTVSADGFDSQTITITQEKFSMDMITVVESSNQFNCYPNPFKSEINIKIQNPSRNKITVAIYDLAGKEIKNLVSASKDEQLDIIWNGTNDLGQPITSGIYICKMNNLAKLIVFTGN